MFRSSMQAFRAFSTRGSQGRVFPQFTVYGSDALLQLSPIAPVYTNAGSYLKLKRGGSLMLTWCKKTSNGYNYQEKYYFALTPAEIGSLLNSLDDRAPRFSLVHSPNANASPPTGDTATKVLAVEYQPEHLKTVFEYGSSNDRAAVALSSGEVRVFKELLQYSIPFLYGFHSTLANADLYDLHSKRLYPSDDD
ncbi:hypothetical protein, variant [Aphanomyces astaci]|uniref:Uncharacterized protein n=1 Tax=Aphanomyces astaci TaxID=112090 RepID=W4GLI9_APHAT|nr:hypothetical protein, variant [Aphanomyces astaci]ETV80221.1 hypothetical protein, variant [Aphanomyces astaci]KAF0708036.1 hypothetical protein AaE_013377 [Aphanomyces astaci]|eukprot:XP_009830145.1 hypothetical protein, variant [Aphanomyces astaci]